MSDVKLQIGDMKFNWDSEKAALNWHKHRVDFNDAAMVFADENRIELFDEIHSDEEDRWQVIGKVNEILFVVYTERIDEIRIISARKATSYERRIYYDRAEDY